GVSGEGGLTPDGLLGAVILLNGDRWTVVDVAPAEPLAEMTAAILEEEGFVAVVRPADPLDDVYAHLGASRVGTTVVLVPEQDATRATDLIAETVTDYQGDELEKLLASGASIDDILSGDDGEDDDAEDDGEDDELPPTGGARGDA
ncbi:MAG: hypothetical protein WD336_07495, partial [Trueperaceae bacterium]